jgi:hypothetical protein
MSTANSNAVLDAREPLLGDGAGLAARDSSVRPCAHPSLRARRGPQGKIALVPPPEGLANGVLALFVLAVVILESAA